MSYKYIFTMKGLSKTINGKLILKETFLSFLYGAKIGIIGHNGAGKSSLLKIMSGLDKEYEGEAFAADGIRIGYFAQEPKLDNDKTVFENIMQGLQYKKQLLDDFNTISNKFSTVIDSDEVERLLAQQSALQEQIDICNAWEIDREVEIAMQALRCPAKESLIQNISGGEKRRVALCKLLLEQPDMLLLDEPTNHLDAESVSWLENYLKNYKSTVISITHDRYFLDNVAEWILEIDRGETIVWHSNYSAWLEQKHQKLLQEQKTDNLQKKQIQNELEWVKQSAKGRQKKSKARINAYQELINNQQNRVYDTPQIIIPSGPRLGELVIEIQNLNKKLGDKILFSDFSCNIPKAAIVGIVGPNGVGKTSLFNMLSGRIKADSGIINIGPTVQLQYVDQMRDYLDDNKTVWEEISDSLDVFEFNKCTIKTRLYCAAFNFKGAVQQKKIRELSGGERNRVHLAKSLRSSANVILLDEPSNDLDISTLRNLEDAILEFPGCIIVISHDRWFLDRIATHILVFDTNSPKLFEGNYSDYQKSLNITNNEEVIKYKHKKLL
ncbi:energy-dependent translational throttle protein EttA [Rickettsia endosymbiont of Cardiosporidium cionae]|uniref:energy-dependent translational throttle protein EttA n=1 Tax=Rickettsia endosymbiont of Cardiosporidium cionae TaxID=2777155 RepID=UPI001893F2DA|nr:energy-dependent translational throttle protein EttA [Rickettsia endosymbiont of Cardiosporidium cionae]KAF8818283.1 energy-dependent translational throttle protein EttA [Rickettsia endosymbiont of Cardiosporidium cionae]